jgi:hypothetical protein
VVITRTVRRRVRRQLRNIDSFFKLLDIAERRRLRQSPFRFGPGQGRVRCLRPNKVSLRRRFCSRTGMDGARVDPSSVSATVADALG